MKLTKNPNNSWKGGRGLSPELPLFFVYRFCVSSLVLFPPRPSLGACRITASKLEHADSCLLLIISVPCPNEPRVLDWTGLDWTGLDWT